MRAPRGSVLCCVNWQIQAAYRRLQNNLDPEVAKNPDALAVYGGMGKAACNFDCCEANLVCLRRLREDETLLEQSAKPVDVPHPGKWALGADGQLQPGAQISHRGALCRARPEGLDDVVNPKKSVTRCF